MKQKIVVVHAFYEQYGGEDNSFGQEIEIFRRLGFDVVELIANNSSLSKSPLTAVNAIFHLGYFLKTVKLISQHKPNFVYVNNLWPAISPSPLFAARLLRVPTLQAVRNYRLICPSAKLDDAGRCTICKGSSHPWSCVRAGCYRASPLQSFTVYLSSTIARIICRSWRQHRYLATSHVVADLLELNGIDLSKVGVRPNFISVMPQEISLEVGQQAVYVGRLSEEKGVLELATNWPADPNSLKLSIIGDGPMRALILELAKTNPNISYLGHCSKEEVTQILSVSAVSFVPSRWAEPFGRSAIESLSVGTPVICSRAGALPDIVGDAGVIVEELTTDLIVSACEHVISAGAALRQTARARFESHYNVQSATEDMRRHLEIVLD